MLQLQQNQLEASEYEKLHSSVNLRTDFQKNLEKRIRRQPIAQISDDLKKQRENNKRDRIFRRISKEEGQDSERDSDENSISSEDDDRKDDQANKPIVNLFNLASYKGKEANVGKSTVVTAAQIARKKVTALVEQETSYRNLNPFKEQKKGSTENDNPEFEEEIELPSEDQILIDIEKLEGKKLIKALPAQRNEFPGNQKKNISSKSGNDEDIDIEDKLPIYKKEYEVMESIKNNLVTIICGETGTGKSTQLPQILKQYGLARFGRIGVTQPRRLAAISLAKRVADELQSQLGELVGYQVRFEASKMSTSTEIKFMTDGILLNEMISDLLLRKYSCIIIDEAHERSINTDILIGLLSRVVRMRAKLSLKERKENPGADSYLHYPLRLVIMSATLRTDDFTTNKYLFPNKKINVVELDSRQFEVSTYMEKKTPIDYVDAAIKKVCKIHSKLSSGGILVFLTGEEEIKYFCSKLQAELDTMKAIKAKRVRQDEKFDEKIEQKKMQDGLIDSDIEELENEEEEEIREEDNNIHEQTKRVKVEEEITLISNKLFIPTNFTIYPLYSKLPLAEQEAIFSHSSDKNRQIVVATNIAETSLTIKNIKYVVDSGKEKRSEYSQKNKIGRYVIDWTSQSSSNQRSGRAGRTTNGFCYRLYSRAIFDKKFKQFPDPEIMNDPLDVSCLKLKAIGIKNIKNFPFITKPPEESLKQAINELVYLKAIEKLDSQKITNLGKALSFLPIPPRYGKLLLLSRSVGMVEYGTLLVASLVSEQFFSTRKLKEKNREHNAENRNDKKSLIETFKATYKDAIVQSSDIITKANVLGQFLSSVLQQSKNDKFFENNRIIDKFARDKFLVFKTLKESYQLILHVMRILSVLDQEYKHTMLFEKFYSNFKCLRNAKRIEVLTDSLVACCVSNVCRRVETFEDEKRTYSYETIYSDKPSKIHPISVVKGQDPEFAIFTEAIEIEETRVYLTGVTIIKNPEILFKYDFTKQDEEEDSIKRKDLQPSYNSTLDKVVEFKEATFGPKLWQLPMFIKEFSGSLEKKAEVFRDALLQGKVVRKFILKKEYQVSGQFPQLLKNFTHNLAKYKAFNHSSFIEVCEEDGNNLKDSFLALIKKGGLREKVREKWDSIIG